MAVTKWRLVGFFCAAVLVQRAAPSAEVMGKMSAGFGKVAEECKTELNIGDHIMMDFMNYWKEEYQLVNRDLGCIILCMAKKLNLFSADSKMHQENSHAFAKSHGADDATAKELVGIVQACETAAAGVADDCDRVLDMAKCFRTKIHALKWAPTMEVAMEELMTGA